MDLTLGDGLNILADMLKILSSIGIVVVLCLVFSVFRDNIKWYDFVILEGIKLLPIVIMARKFFGHILIGEISGITLAGMEWLLRQNPPFILLLTVGVLTSFLLCTSVYLTRKRKVFIILLVGLFILSVFIDFWTVYYQDIWTALQTLIYW